MRAIPSRWDEEERPEPEDSYRRPVAGWLVACAAAIPILMVGSWLIAEELQRRRYSPVRQSVSVLAGYAGTDRWIVTGALYLVAGCYLVLALGLSMFDVRARVGLVVAGVSAAGIGICPEPVHGSTPQHLAFTALGAITIAIWPGLVARQVAALSGFDEWVSVIACLVFLALLGWAFFEARAGSELGLAERLSSSSAICWPLVVISALRQESPSRPMALIARRQLRSPQGSHSSQSVQG